MTVELMADVIKYTNDTNKDIPLDHSEFPHNLVTVDYGPNDEVIAVSVIVPHKVRLEIHDYRASLLLFRNDRFDDFESIRNRAIKEIPRLRRVVEKATEALRRIKNG